MAKITNLFFTYHRALEYQSSMTCPGFFVFIIHCENQDIIPHVFVVETSQEGAMGVYKRWLGLTITRTENTTTPPNRRDVHAMLDELSEDELTALVEQCRLRRTQG